MLKNTGVFFEDRGSHTYAPSRAVLDRPPPTHVALQGIGFGAPRHHITVWAVRAAGRPAPFPQKGVGASGRPELVRPSSRRALDPKPRSRMSLALGRWVVPPPRRGAKGRGGRLAFLWASIVG